MPSELRQEPCTKRWVLISPERAKRPHEFIEEKKRIVIPEWEEKCPFCPGNESLTPPEIFAFRAVGTKPNEKGWRARVIPNKYPVLALDREEVEVRDMEPYVSVSGTGEHEVVIETPFHNKTFGNMEREEIEEVINCYLERYRSLREDKRIKYICIFRNHGERAGTSLIHPHSQIIATPIVPEGIRAEVEEARRYYDDRLRCAYCDIISREKEAGERVVLETEFFLCFEPFASRMPFETWIVPKNHKPSFDQLDPWESRDLALAFEGVFTALYKGLEDPHYNMVIHSAPLRDSCEDYYHWHIEILPRLTVPAGFELGTDIYINTLFPEEAAKFLRQVLAGKS